MPAGVMIPNTTATIPSVRTLRILLADDNRDAADTLAVLLEMGGHYVVTAYDGQQAVNAACEETFDVGVLDLGMPKIDGYQLAVALRGLHEDIYLIAISGWATGDDVARTRAAGFKRHMAKPANIMDLLDELARIRVERASK